MNKETKLIKKARVLSSAINALLDAKNELQEEFVFSGFREGHTPMVALNGDLEVMLVYGCYAMDMSTALDYMFNVGYITPMDFE